MPRKLQQDRPREPREPTERAPAPTSRSGDGTSQTRAATAEDVARLMGDLEPATITQILALQPSLGEVECAIAWSRGEGDLLGPEGLSLSGKAAQVFEIIDSEIEAPEEP